MDNLARKYEHLNEMEAARRRLSSSVRVLAHMTAREVGFGWVGVPDAPDTIEKLRAAHEISRQTGRPLPISNQHCDRVIYQDEATNIAMRFWHDTAHVSTGMTFTVDDELELGVWHLKKLRGVFNPNSLEYRLFEIDILGQNYLQAVAHKFPADQRAFVETCLAEGLHEGVLIEARK